MNKAKWGSNFSKRRVTLRLEQKLIEKVKVEARTRGLSAQRVLEACIHERFDELSQEERDTLIVRRLNRIDLGQRILRHRVEIVAEALAAFVRMWLAAYARSARIAAQAAAIQAHVRFERYLAIVSNQVQRGDKSLTGMSDEIVVKESDFSPGSAA